MAHLPSAFDEAELSGPLYCSISGGGSVNVSKSRSNQSSQSGIQYPSDFLRNIGSTIGRPFTIEEISSLAPRTSSLFGAPAGGGYPGQQQQNPYGAPPAPYQPSPQQIQQYGQAPTQPVQQFQPPPSSYFPQQQTPAPQPVQGQPFNPAQSDLTPGQLLQMNDQRQQQSAGLQAQSVPQNAAGPFGQASVGAPQPGPRNAASTPGMFTEADLTGVLGNQFTDEKQRQEVMRSVTRALENQGWKPGQPFSEEMLRRAAETAGGYEKGKFIQNVLPGLVQSQGEIEQQFSDINRFGSPQTPQGPGVDVQGGINRLGFGQAPRDAAAPGIREPGQIGGNTIGSSQSNIAPAGFESYRDAIFRAQFDPVRRETERQGAISDRELRAQLAQTGLSSSGAGIGQLAQQRENRNVQLQGQAADAAARAAQQSFGTQFQQEQQNAQLRQERNLQQAGLDQNAQVQNANNILQGDFQRGDLMLRTLGLNNQAAQQARQDFLGLLGIQEQDLARIDKQQLESVSLMFNTYLQQFAAITNAGQFSQGQGSSNAKGTGVSGYGSFGSTGGGGGGGQ